MKQQASINRHTDGAGRPYGVSTVLEVKIRIIELGSNSFQLHGFEVTNSGTVRHRWGVRRRVRLVEGLSPDGTLDSDYAAAGVSAVGELLAESQDEHPLVCFATSAVREANNREILLGPLAAHFNIAPRILTGAEEAKLAYDGALTTLDGPVHRICVVDIGGGSTELAVGDHRGVGFTHSARVGSLLGASAPAAFRLQLAPVLRRVRYYEPDRLVFACGAARALKALLVAQGVSHRDDSISTELIERLLPNLGLVNAADLEAFGVEAEQRTALATGAGLVLAVARALGVSYLDVSDGGLREGAALREWNRRRLRSGGCNAPIADRRSPLPYVSSAGGWLPMLGT